MPKKKPTKKTSPFLVKSLLTVNLLYMDGGSKLYTGCSTEFTIFYENGE